MTLSSDERERRLNRCCKTCGERMNSLDTRKVVCSVECGFEGRRQKKVVVDCVVCGVSVQRYRKAVNSQSVFCCSNLCQKQWALITNHSSKNCVSNAEKMKWRKSHAAVRRVSSAGHKWWRKCVVGMRNLIGHAVVSEWEIKCRSASQCLKQRTVITAKSKEQKCSDNWDSTVRTKFANLKTRRYFSEGGQWEKRCHSAVTSINRRFKD